MKFCSALLLIATTLIATTTTNVEAGTISTQNQELELNVENNVGEASVELNQIKRKIIERKIEDGSGNNSTIAEAEKYQQTIRYTLGHRNAFVDKIIGQSANTYSYPALKNIFLTICYPANGNSFGKIVTFVEIIVDQLSTIGRAYISEGNIGQRRLCVKVEAGQTYSLSYRTTFYGY